MNNIMNSHNKNNKGTKQPYKIMSCTNNNNHATTNHGNKDINNDTNNLREFVLNSRHPGPRRE